MCIGEMDILLVVAIVTGIVGYVYVTLTTTSGSAYDDNSIDAFIIEDNSDTDRVPQASNNNDRYCPCYVIEGRQILILYGTEYGFSEEVARKLFDRILVMTSDALALQPRIINAKHYTCVDWSQEQVCFFVISTSGDGVPPSDAREFFESVMNSQESLDHICYSVLALGDSNYPQFCKAGKELDIRMQVLAGNCVVKRRDVDMEDWSVIDCWMDTVLAYLQTCEILPRIDYLKLPKSDATVPDRHSPFFATMKVKRPLTQLVDVADKETIHCEFDIRNSGITWQSGDALGIYPENNPDHVTSVLLALNTTESAVYTSPPWAYKPCSNTVDIETLLQKYYDIKYVKPELIQLLSENVMDIKQREITTTPLRNGTSKSNKMLHDYVSQREVVDVLQDNNSVKLSPKQLLPCLRPLQPRYYSVSSSPLHDSSTVCVTAAVVRYQLLGNNREGVTTTYLADRVKEGQSCPIFISRNPDFRLPNNHYIPVILIGPGTGIAPFRAFIQERELHGFSGLTYLYFGCRHRIRDYLYQDELEAWEEKGIIKLRTAFSRDQKNKVYVQDFLKEDSHLLWQLINQNRGHIYVCGDARNMAKDVHHTLIDIVTGCGNLNINQARDYLFELEKQGRYQKDVWVT